MTIHLTKSILGERDLLASQFEVFHLSATAGHVEEGEEQRVEPEQGAQREPDNSDPECRAQDHSRGT